MNRTVEDYRQFYAEEIQTVAALRFDYRMQDGVALIAGRNLIRVGRLHVQSGDTLIQIVVRHWNR